MRKINYSFTLSEEVISKLSMYASKKNISKSAAVNEILEKTLDTVNISVLMPTSPYIETEADKKAEEEFLNKEKDV